MFDVVRHGSGAEDLLQVRGLPGLFYPRNRGWYWSPVVVHNVTNCLSVSDE